MVFIGSMTCTGTFILKVIVCSCLHLLLSQLFQKCLHLLQGGVLGYRSSVRGLGARPLTNFNRVWFSGFFFISLGTIITTSLAYWGRPAFPFFDWGFAFYWVTPGWHWPMLGSGPWPMTWSRPRSWPTSRPWPPWSSSWPITWPWWRSWSIPWSTF